jgi:hypothetical protein
LREWENFEDFGGAALPKAGNPQKKAFFLKNFRLGACQTSF